MRKYNMKRNRVNENGSTIIIVLAVLILMLSMGLAFLTMMRQDAAGSLQIKDAKVQAAPEQAAIDYVGGLLARDVINMLHPKQLNSGGTGRFVLSGKPDSGTGTFNFSDQTYESYDYPGYFDTWLANNEPNKVLYGSSDEIYTDWNQISRPDGLPFIDPLTFLPLRTDSSNRIRGFTTDGGIQIYQANDASPAYDDAAHNMHTAKLPFLMLPPEDMKRGYTRNIKRLVGRVRSERNIHTGPVVDNDNDGYGDGRWFEAPIASSNGIRWAMSMRIIDNSGMVNINTATKFNTDSYDVTGSTPADVDLFSILFDPNPSVLNPVAANDNEMRGEFSWLLSTRALNWVPLDSANPPPSTDDISAFHRETLWRYQGNVINNNQVGIIENALTGRDFVDNGLPARPLSFGSFGIDTEADLRLSHDLVRKPGMVSELDHILDRYSGRSKSTVRTQGNVNGSDGYRGEGFLGSRNHVLLTHNNLDGNSAFNNERAQRDETSVLTRSRRKHLTTMSGARDFRPRHLVDQRLTFADALLGPTGDGLTPPIPNYNELQYSYFKADLNKIKMAEIFTDRDLGIAPNVRIFHGFKPTLDINGKSDPYDKYAAEHYARLFFDAFLNTTQAKGDGITTRGLPSNRTDLSLPYSAYLFDEFNAAEIEAAADRAYSLAANLLAYRQSSGAPIRRGDADLANRAVGNNTISESNLAIDGDADYYGKRTGEDASLPLTFKSHRDDQDLNPTYSMVRRYKDVHDFSTAQEVVYYYGVKKQPYFKELSMLIFYEDDGKSESRDDRKAGAIDPTGEKGGEDKKVDKDIEKMDIYGGGDVTQNMAVFIELGNPYNTPIDLTHFWIQLTDGELPVRIAAAGLTAAQKTIPAHGRVVLMSSGLNNKVAHLKSSFTGTPLVIEIAEWNGAYMQNTFPLDGTQEFKAQLWYSRELTTLTVGDLTPTDATTAVKAVMVDRLRGANYRPNVVDFEVFEGGDDENGVDGNIVVYDVHIRRDEKHNAAEGFPRYIYENRFYNEANDTTRNELTNGRVFKNGATDLANSKLSDFTFLGNTTYAASQNTNYTALGNHIFSPLQIVTRNQNYDKNKLTVNGKLGMNDGNLQSVAELGSLLTCSHKYDVTNGWTVASEGLANGSYKTTAKNDGQLIAHLGNPFSRKINPYGRMAHDAAARQKAVDNGTATDPRDLKPNLPLGLNLFQQVTVIKPAAGNVLVPGVININTASQDVLMTLPYANPLMHLKNRRPLTTDLRNDVLADKNNTANPDFEYNIARGLVAYRDMAPIVGDLDYSTPAAITSLTPEYTALYGGRRDMMYRYFASYNKVATDDPTFVDPTLLNYSLGRLFVDGGARADSITDELMGVRNRLELDQYHPNLVTYDPLAAKAPDGVSQTLEDSRHRRNVDGHILAPSNSDRVDAGFVYPSEMLMVVNQIRDNTTTGPIPAGVYPTDTQYSIAHFHSNKQDDSVDVIDAANANVIQHNLGRFGTVQPSPHTATGFDPVQDATVYVDPTTITANTMPHDVVPTNLDSFGLVDDAKELLLPYARMSNMVTTRSDVFTAYITLQGRKYAGELSDGEQMRKVWKPVVTKRFLVVFDRSNVFKPGDKPRVIMKMEIK